MVKVLIVEDDYSLQELYKMSLKRQGLELSGIAANGQEAVDLFKNNSEKPDIIIMDHRMPIKNGIEALKEIFELDHNVTIIFASADVSIKEEALNLGAKAFLEKPFSLKILLKTIKNLLMLNPQI